MSPNIVKNMTDAVVIHFLHNSGNLYKARMSWFLFICSRGSLSIKFQKVLFFLYDFEHYSRSLSLYLVASMFCLIHLPITRQNTHKKDN